MLRAQLLPASGPKTIDQTHKDYFRTVKDWQRIAGTILRKAVPGYFQVCITPSCTAS